MKYDHHRRSLVAGERALYDFEQSRMARYQTCNYRETRRFTRCLYLDE